MDSRRLRTSGRAYWDNLNNKFTSKAPNKLIVPTYHNGYKLLNY